MIKINRKTRRKRSPSFFKVCHLLTYVSEKQEEMTEPSSVKVAVRVRPLVPNEIDKGFQNIIDTIPQNEQVVIKSIEKAFTFNYVLGADSPQEELYDRCVAPLLKNLFQGFNVTIFAYGQTGSGKTHSMGTAFSETDTPNMGVIPRAVREIFNYIKDQFSVDFTMSVSFTELYREVLYDLLAERPRDQCVLEIREDNSKGVYIPNVTEKSVQTADDVLKILVQGSLGRSTAATNMNSRSSRSHSIFAINMAMQHKSDKTQNKTAKLCLVDLAGSERPKKTGAQGTTFKEGVDINKGLFVLGNVISALGDEKSQNLFIPYRDSNLTRLLKDSLGGNSMTLMIACISPADSNLEETLSTLRYADRARRIKNKPIVNQDPKTAEINRLKKEIQLMKLEIAGQEGSMLSASEFNKLKVQLSNTLLDKADLQEKLIILQNVNKTLSQKLRDLKSACNDIEDRISTGLASDDWMYIKEGLEKLHQMQNQLEDIQKEQTKAENDIKAHEETFGILLNVSKGFNTSKDLEEATSHTDRQMVLTTEFQEVSKQLAVKERLAAQLALNTQHMLLDHHVLVETEKKIEALVKEKEELSRQLRIIKSQENTGKLAEQRRKRVLELEDQLRDLKKKLLDYAKLLKLRERDELKMKKLNQEIISMKSTKVMLLKQMRQENEQFKAFKQLHQRELAKAVQQDRKKEYEMVKMKMAYEKQKNVLKRKFEEAAALNKRLQSTIIKRKNAQQMSFTGKIEKVSSWLKEELEMYVNLAEVDATLSGLIEDRATLQRQLDDLKSNPDTAESVEAKNIEEDIVLRSVQIQDLQQKILDTGEENRGKPRFDVVQTMVEAKYALSNLFEQAAEYQRSHVHTKREMAEYQEREKELQEKLTHLTEENKALQDRFLEQMAQEQQIHQNKMELPSTQTRLGGNCTDADSQNELSLQIEHIKHQENVIEEQAQKIGALEQRLKEIEEKALSAKTPPRPNFQKPVQYLSVPFLDTTQTLEEIDSDDVDKDPDWRKTPLAKRLKVLKIESKVGMRESSMPLGSKRSSDGGCSCKKCSTLRCKCRKLGRPCTELCKCVTTDCENKNEPTENCGTDTKTSNNDESELDTKYSAKKPRFNDISVQDQKKLFPRNRLDFSQ
ncbi:chromosome-associated kinesin KIF4A isoform X2 [Euwallacea fornicatus]|uniref:chromosome-associated kinesin KIF4A isoform X2 n=1 Tax=Euwallacea fornicatus TaxID=995702 RepID=UPI00338E2C7A